MEKLIYAIAELCCVVITAFIIPYLKNKISNEKFEKIKQYVSTAVKAAEMIYRETGLGKEKKEYVKKFLEDKGITIDKDVLDNMIESICLELQK